MNTFIVKTATVTGKRGAKTTETFVVVAKSDAHARCQAIAAAHPGAEVTGIEHVPVIKRVSVGS
jgi:hypothetical protein